MVESYSIVYMSKRPKLQRILSKYKCNNKRVLTNKSRNITIKLNKEIRFLVLVYDFIYLIRFGLLKSEQKYLSHALTSRPLNWASKNLRAQACVT